MGSINIHFDKDALYSDISGKASNTSSEFSKVIDNIKETIGIQLSIETPVLSGDLVGANLIIDTGPYSFYTDNDQPYYPFVVMGTSPHSIDSPVLIEGVGWRYIGEHPGTAANDYPDRSLENSMSEIESKCDEFLSWLVE